MKLISQLVAASLVLLAWNACQKEHENPETESLPSGQLVTSGAILAVCDDTTAFKSNVDLQPLEYLQNCYSCSAIKQVPGLEEEIPWVGNCQVRIVWDTVLTFSFMTYQPYFDELFLREELYFHIVPIDVGTFTVSDINHWQQNQSLSYGSYGRLLDDGDVLDAYWAADTLCTNHIEITRLNLEDKEVEGKFELHLNMKKQGAHGVLYSERINFLNGRFKAEIED